MPAPKSAFSAYVEAARAGDHQALYAMMTRESQLVLGPRGTELAVSRARAELAELAREASKDTSTWRIEARVRLEDGDVATLVVEDGTFRIDGADGLPPHAETPEAALSELRRALKRAQATPLAKLLTRARREAFERDLGSLIEALRFPHLLDTRVVGDRATTHTPGGHVVRLRREFGVWKVENID